MRLGLLADVHEAVPQLREVLDRFRYCSIDEVIVLGDICGMHRHLHETAEGFRKAPAGNHRRLGFRLTPHAGVL